MRRLLLPVLSISVAVSALAFGSTYAAFTASDTESGSVAAGKAEIRLNTLAGVPEMSWNVSLTCQSDNMGPGDVCEDDVNVFNDGSVTLFYTITDNDALPCFDVSHDPPVDTKNGGDGNTPFKLPPPVAPFATAGTREIERIRARVELLNVSGCEGATASVGIQVIGSTSP